MSHCTRFAPGPRRCLLLLALLGFAGCGGGDGGGGKSLTQAFENARKLTLPADRVRALVRVSEQQRAAGDVAGASKSIELAAKACGEIGDEDPAMKADALNSVASAQAKVGLTAAAKNLLRDVRRAAEAIPEPAGRAKALARLASTYGTQLDSRDTGVVHLRAAEEAANSVEDAGAKATALAEVAAAADALGEGERAAGLLESALAQARAASDERQQAEALGEVALRYALVEQRERALELLTEAEGIAGNIGESMRRAYALLHLAEKRRAAGDAAGGFKLLEQAQTAADQVEQSLKGPLVGEIDRLRSRWNAG